MAVDPPAPHVTVTNKGRKARDMRSRRARRFELPIEVFGGKNSRLKYVELGGRAAILEVIFSIVAVVNEELKQFVDDEEKLGVI